MKRPQRIVAPVAVVLALAACSISTAREDVTVYAPALSSSTQPLPRYARVRAWQLVVLEPQAISPLDGARIVVVPQPGVLEFYKGARWRDRAPTMVQELMVQAFQDSGNLGGIGTPASGARGDFLLQTDLRDFQVEYRGSMAPFVVIRLFAQVLEHADDRVIATRTFEMERPCSGTSLSAVFAAFEQGLNLLLPQIVAWTGETADTITRAKSHPMR